MHVKRVKRAKDGHFSLEIFQPCHGKTVTMAEPKTHTEQIRKPMSDKSSVISQAVTNMNRGTDFIFSSAESLTSSGKENGQIFGCVE